MGNSRDDRGNPVNYYEYLENETVDEWSPYQRHRHMPVIPGMENEKETEDEST